MTILLISIVIFLLILAAGCAGLHVQKRLADEHKTARRRRSGGGAAHPSPGAGPGNTDRRQFRLLLDPEDRTGGLFGPDSPARSGARAIWTRHEARARQTQGGNRQRL